MGAILSAVEMDAEARTRALVARMVGRSDTGPFPTHALFNGDGEAVLFCSADQAELALAEAQAAYPDERWTMSKIA